MKLSESELIKEMSLLQGTIWEKCFSLAVAEVYILDLIKVDLIFLHSPPPPFGVKETLLQNTLH